LFGSEEEAPDEVSESSEATAPVDAGETPESMEDEWAAMLGAEAATAEAEPATAEAAPESDLDAVIPAEPEEEGAPTESPAEPVGEVELGVDEIIAPGEETTEAPTELPILATATAQPAPPVQEAGEMTYTTSPSYEAETPPSPMYAEPTVPAEEAPASLPPPREKPEAYDPVVRARMAGALFSTQTEKPSEEDLLPDGPRSAAMELRDVTEYEVGQPSRVRPEREVLDYVGLKQRQALWEEIAALYKQVPEVLCADPLQDEALDLLRKSQDILMEKPRQFDVAQYQVGQVRSILITRNNINRWTNTWGYFTLFYQILWIVVAGGAILYAPYFVSQIEAIVGASGTFISVGELWNTAAWGGIGGVLGALYSLYWHAAKLRDFHKQYLMWYIVQPVIGLIIGSLVYVVIGAGFLNMIGSTQSGQDTPLRLFPYAVACIASFRQRFILEVVDRIIQFLTGAGSKEEEEAKPAAAQPIEMEIPAEEA
jgi:hypothetical protein